MKLKKATEADNHQLIEFYKETTFASNFHVHILKHQSFFSQYRLQSDDYVTYMLVDDRNEKEIKGLVSLVFREAWVAGEKCMVAYATDLRVLPQRKAILEWTNLLIPQLLREREERNCKYVFSVVAKNQIQAFNAFIRPRSHRRELPRYYLFRRFDVISLHGILPFSPSPLKSITTRSGQERDLPAIAEYVSKRMHAKSLQFNGTPEVFLKNFKRWEMLKVEDFELAIDKENNIVGCTALWDPSPIESFIPLKYDAKTLTLKEALQFFSLFGITKKLANPNSKFNFLVLSYLLADNPDIFYSLLYKCFRRAQRNQFLVYPHFEGDLLSQPPMGFISSKINAGLYCILSPGDPVPEFLKPKVLSEAPDFDLAFL